MGHVSASGRRHRRRLDRHRDRGLAALGRVEAGARRARADAGRQASDGARHRAAARTKHSRFGDRLLHAPRRARAAARAELKRAHRANEQVGVLMLDLDFFKSVNDRYGHQCGDAVLANIGHTIMQTLRVSDVRARWGGEEFLVALPESGLDQAKRVAAALSRKIANTVTECDSARIQLTTSIGITSRCLAKKTSTRCWRGLMPRSIAPKPTAAIASVSCWPTTTTMGPSDTRRSPGALPVPRSQGSQSVGSPAASGTREALNRPPGEQTLASPIDSLVADVARVRATLA